MTSDIRQQIAYSGHAEPDHDGITRLIRQLINMPRLETAPEGEPIGILTIIGGDKRPEVARDDPPRCSRALAQGQDRIGRSVLRERVSSALNAGESGDFRWGVD